MNEWKFITYPRENDRPMYGIVLVDGQGHVLKAIYRNHKPTAQRIYKQMNKWWIE